MQVTVCFVSTIPDQARKYISEKLKDLKNVELIFKTNSSEEEFLYDISRAEILIGWRPSKKLLLNAKRARLFINPGAGIQPLIGLFREINNERELLLINGHGNSYFVAQHAVALLLTLMNKVIPHNEWMRNGRWRTGDIDAASVPLRFKNVGFLGYGAINQKIHRFLSGFDVEFSILRKHWEKQKSPLPTEVCKFEYPQLHEFLKRIDILFIGVPLTSMTRRLIKKRELELLGKESFVVNIARGDIIDEESLYISLKEKIINGAAIDVWYNYIPESDKDDRRFPFHFPFHTLDNIILSPHRGYSPFNDLLRWDEIIENIQRMANDRKDFLNIVDLDEEY
ncbi:MAG: NAD(P)-dependent oxidoreductase [Promethearchaeota archaeon]